MREAVDTIRQRFDYPTAMSIEYATREDIERTAFEVETADETVAYELVETAPGTTWDPSYPASTERRVRTHRSGYCDPYSSVSSS